MQALGGTAELVWLDPAEAMRIHTNEIIALFVSQYNLRGKLMFFYLVFNEYLTSHIRNSFTFLKCCQHHSRGTVRNFLVQETIVFRAADYFGNGNSSLFSHLCLQLGQCLYAADELFWKISGIIKISNKQLHILFFLISMYIGGYVFY